MPRPQPFRLLSGLPILFVRALISLKVILHESLSHTHAFFSVSIYSPFSLKWWSWMIATGVSIAMTTR